MTDAGPSAGSRRISLRKRAAAAPVAEPVAPVPGKGRPTPKRSAAQRRRGGPVAPPPSNRREAAKRLREQRRSGTAPAREPRLLARDAGPVRALVRDVVDLRRNFAVLLLPVALLLVAAQLTRSLVVLSVATRMWVVTLLVVIADTVATALSIRKQVHAEFPDVGRAGGHIGYGLLRTTVFRRFRQPAARVSPPPLRRR